MITGRKPGRTYAQPWAAGFRCWSAAI